VFEGMVQTVQEHGPIGELGQRVPLSVQLQLSLLFVPLLELFLQSQIMFAEFPQPVDLFGCQLRLFRGFLFVLPQLI